MQPPINLSELITIVVPCKNEQNYIAHLLTHLRLQNIGRTRVIIADCSTDATREVIAQYAGDLNIEVIPGGPVSIAKNSGAKLAATPYLLFIDADVRFFKLGVIHRAVQHIVQHNLDLVGLNVRCYDSDLRAKIGFGVFNVVNNILKHFSPFAVGGFMLTRTDRFWQVGGFSETCITSEDYFLSKQYSPQKFSLVRDHFGQDSRRFKQMGYFGMAQYLVKNFINRNNPAYWQKSHHNQYWT